MSVTLRRTALAIAVGALGPVLSATAPPLAARALAAPPLAVTPLAAPPPAVAPGPGDPAGGWPGSDERRQPPGQVFVEVRPGMVRPGYLVGIRASCHDNSIPATVVSDAFGRIQAHPQYGHLTASAMVRDRTRPGNYPVKLECRDGGSASTMLQVVKHVKSSPGPHTGFGGTAGGANAGGLLVPGGLALTIAGAIVGVVTARRPRGTGGVSTGRPSGTARS
ncbi:hypothetical protein [Micromonospora sp. KC213]|uniref:hypothetical protein n=1 Tax=Micromonospora sp. KC213 TaxID=2530378 RepID=UPI001FB5A345|nr:hypothetical protein [Micromonospora sp. KC213]